MVYIYILNDVIWIEKYVQLFYSFLFLFSLQIKLNETRDKLRESYKSVCHFTNSLLQYYYVFSITTLWHIDNRMWHQGSANIQRSSSNRYLNQGVLNADHFISYNALFA